MVHILKWFEGLFKALDRLLVTDFKAIDQILQVIFLTDILEATINAELLTIVFIYEAHWVIRQGHTVMVFVKLLHNSVWFVDI